MKIPIETALKSQVKSPMNNSKQAGFRQLRTLPMKKGSRHQTIVSIWTRTLLLLNFLSRTPSPSTLFLLTLFLLSFLAPDRLWLQPAYAAKQLVFSRSQTQEMSSSLQAWGVPAFVMVAGKKQTGFFVTAISSGLGLDLGLASGDVLVNIAGRQVESGPQIDKILTETKAGNLRAQIARVRGTRISLLNPMTRFEGYSKAAVPQAKQEVIMISGSRRSDRPEVEIEDKPYERKEAPNQSALEDHMFSLVNQDRRANGIAPVRRSQGLSRVARAYAEDMGRRGFFDHRDPEGRLPVDRARQAGIQASVWENIAWQEAHRSYENLVDRCQNAMMSEPKDDPNNHRGNILRPQHQVTGIGVAAFGSRVICVQEFSADDVP